jgi:hypothetical protein
VAVRVGDRDEIVVSVGHGLVFCASGRAGPTLAIRPGGRGDVTGTHVAWRETKGSPFVPSPVLHGDRLYMVNDMASIATAYEAASGDATSGETFVLRAGPQFEVLRVNRLEAAVLASPALVDGHFYFRTEGELLAIGR